VELGQGQTHISGLEVGTVVDFDRAGVRLAEILAKREVTGKKVVDIVLQIAEHSLGVVQLPVVDYILFGNCDTALATSGAPSCANAYHAYAQQLLP
jgi:hypothetical protein